MDISDNSLLDSDRLRSDGVMSQTSCVRRHPHTHAHTSQRRQRSTSAVLWSAPVTVKRRCIRPTSVCRRHRAPVLVITSGQRILTKAASLEGCVTRKEKSNSYNAFIYSHYKKNCITRDPSLLIINCITKSIVFTGALYTLPVITASERSPCLRGRIPTARDHG